MRVSERTTALFKILDCVHRSSPSAVSNLYVLSSPDVAAFGPAVYDVMYDMSISAAPVMPCVECTWSHGQDYQP
eukprot:SAG31_NODE_37094_length_307_cov_0.975962_1_plen_73_part_10